MRHVFGGRFSIGILEPSRDCVLLRRVALLVVFCCAISRLQLCWVFLFFIFHFSFGLNRFLVIRVLRLTGDFVQKAAGDGGALFAPLHSGKRKRQRQSPLGPGDTNVT